MPEYALVAWNSTIASTVMLVQQANVANEPRAVALQRRVGSICVLGAQFESVTSKHDRGGLPGFNRMARNALGNGWRCSSVLEPVLHLEGDRLEWALCISVLRNAQSVR